MVESFIVQKWNLLSNRFNGSVSLYFILNWFFGFNKSSRHMPSKSTKATNASVEGNQSDTGLTQASF